MSSSQEAISLATLLIQKCSSINSLLKARQLHARVITATPPIRKSPYLNNNLLSMYSRCGSLLDSHLVFDEMPQRTIVSYNALIAAYSRSRNNTHIAFDLLKQLNIEGFTPNGPTFTSLLQASSCLKDILLGTSLHTQIVKFEFLSDTLVQTSLLGMYSDCGDLDSSKKVFNSMLKKDAMAWNSIIVGHMKNEKIIEGLYFFKEMINSRAFPTQFTYSMILNACSKLQHFHIGQLTHAKVITSGLPTDVPLLNALLNMYSTFGDTEKALTVFQNIENPDLVSWNSILSGFSGDVGKLIEIFIQFYKVSFVKPDDYTFAIIISATRSLPACSYGKPLHGQVIKLGFDSNVYIGSTLVSMYFDNSDTESAQKLQVLIQIKDIVFWTEMITGHARTGDCSQAIKCFHEMSQEHKIDSFSLSIALSACADLAAKNQGEMIHSKAIKLGLNTEITVSGSLIDMYAKSGDLKSSESVISEIETPDLKCWNSILSGYGHHGKVNKAFTIFDEIVKRGLIPDEVTYLSMLSACNHSGLINKAKFLWSSMNKNGLIPGSKHYSCFVGLLSRAGLLEEAESMIMEIDEHNLEMWRSLLKSCVDRRNIEVGNRVADRILKIGEKDGATFVLLTSFYALMGRWDDVADMRRKMRDFGEKDVGLSWIELWKSTRVFCSGDESHLEVGELRRELMSLKMNLVEQEDYCVWLYV
ncbi:hypothetical protein L1887_31568 [Cichorium endivia]|nr:hypothetical protein L1887_31568 [Cichorium endivia]